MTSPVSRLPLTTAQIAVLQARPVPKAAPAAPPRSPAKTAAGGPGSAAAKQPVALAPAPRPPAPAPGVSGRPPQRGSLVNILA